jgi:predicted nucleic acid-binding protein
LVVIDTSIWIDHFSGRRTSETDALSLLIRNRQAAYVGVILAELLRGRQTPSDRARLEERLAGATYLEMSRPVWRSAGAIAAELDARGERVALTDVFVAAITIEGNHELFTRDKHFERIPGLRLYKPGGDAA